MIFSMISNKSTNVSRNLSSRSVLSRIGALSLAAGLMLTACSNSNSEPANTVVDEDAEQQVVEQGDAEEAAVLGKGRDDADGAVVEHRPVSYDVQNWKAYTGEPLTTDNLDALQQIFGKVTVTDENSLDYASNTAVKYRFMKGEEPYLDIIDSQDYLEFGWYYANPTDSDSEKQTSIEHAKKVYKAATALMGEQGGQLVANILSGQIVKNKQISDHTVELAKCEFYSCMLILDKED